MSSNPFSSPFGSKPAEAKLEVKSKPAGEMDKDDIESYLGDDNKDDDLDDDKKEKEADTELEDDDKKEKEDKELELKEDDEDEEKEKLELKDKEDDLDVPPKKREVLKKYPDFFKEFPAIEKIIFRDLKYTEMFGSFDEAKEIADKSEQFNEFESQLLSGKTDDILKTVKDTDTKAFDKIVDDYLPSLKRVDEAAYTEVCGNIGKLIIMGMANEAKRTNDKDLNDAAEILNEYLFATKDFIPLKLRVPEKGNEEKNEIEKERLEFLNERFESVRDDLTVKVDNILKATIADHIDPSGLMSAFEKKTAIKDALEALHVKVSEDRDFRKNLDRLWKKAFQTKFDKNAVEAIRRNYLGKSKNVLSLVIKSIRQEVLKDKSGRKPKEEDEEKDTSTSRERKPITAGRPSQQKPKANDRQPGESVADYLMRD